MKAFEPEDPMELIGMAIPQEDPDYMAECMIEEYIFLGWNEKQLMSLFTKPFFQATHRIYQDKGEEHVKALIHGVRDRWLQGSTRGGNSLA